MTQTVKKKVIKTVSPLPTFEKRFHRIDGRHAAELAQTLRALATRAHQAVKATCAFEKPSNSLELIDLQTEIHRLEIELETQGLEHLLGYVVALRREVESKLG
jgi:hypothetical protein